VISEHAIIHPTAKIGKGVSIGPWSYIGENVVIGEGTTIHSHVVIKGPTKIGRENAIFQFASIGEIPQDKKYTGENSSLEIGDNNTIRENVTINRGTSFGGGITKIGDNNWIMANVHIAHDCIIGNSNIFANYSALAGHVTIENFTNISGYSGVHQFCCVGSYSFISKATCVTKDVVPYVMIAGYNASACGLNTEGLKRHQFSSTTIENLKKGYKIIFRQGLTVQMALVKLHEILPECPELANFIKVLENSTRGIVR